MAIVLVPNAAQRMVKTSISPDRAFTELAHRLYWPQFMKITSKLKSAGKKMRRGAKSAVKKVERAGKKLGRSARSAGKKVA